MWKNFLSVAVTLYIVTYVTGYSNPGNCSGDCNVHDPAAIRRESDGKYFRFTSHNKVEIATASNLSGPWTNVGSVLPENSVIDLPGKDDIWAPDVQKYGDLYYCFYAVSTFGVQTSAIGVASSSTMEPGTWTDHGAVFYTKSFDQYNAIDPNFIVTSDGLYLLFGSYWQNIFLFQMSSSTKITGSPINLSYNNSGIHAEEGSYIYYAQNHYYLFFSSGVCCGYDPNNLPAQGEEYRINVCRSETITGPYLDANGVSCLQGGGTTVLASHDKVYGPGGQGVFYDAASGGDIIYYHYVHADHGYADGDKFFGWNALVWNNGWPTV